MLEEYGTMQGIKIETAGIDTVNKVISFFTNIRLLNERQFFCFDPGVKLEPGRQLLGDLVMELPARNLVEYALKEWNLKINQVVFNKYSLKVVVANPECCADSWQLLEKAVRRMCLSKVVPVWFEYDSGIIKYRLIQPFLLSGRILPTEYLLMNASQHKKVLAEIKDLFGVEDAMVTIVQIHVHLASSLAGNQTFRNVVVSQINNILSRNWTPNIVFQNDKDFHNLFGPP